MNLTLRSKTLADYLVYCSAVSPATQTAKEAACHPAVSISCFQDDQTFLSAISEVSLSWLYYIPQMTVYLDKCIL